MAKKKNADIPSPPRIPKLPSMPGANGSSPKRKKQQGAEMMPAPQMPLMGEMDGPEGGPMGGMGVMGPTTEERLAEWLATKVLPKNIHGVSYQLRQKSIDGETMAHEWTADEVEGQDPDSLGAMFYSQAMEDSQGSNGVTSYAVHAMRPSDGASFSRCFFRLAQEDMTQGFDSEPGHTPEGHMAQAHRHSEVFARMLVGQTENVMRHYRDQNKELATHASRAIQLQVQVAEMFQKIQDRGMMRDIMLRRVDRKEKMKEKILDYALGFLPDVLSRVGVVPGQLKEVVENAQGLDMVLSTLNDDQVGMVSMALTDPKHKDVFVKAYVGAKQRAAAAQARAAAEAAKKGLPPGQAPAPQLTNGNGVQPGQVAAAAQQQSQVQPTTIAVTKEEAPVLSHATRAFLGAMVDLEDDVFEVVVNKLSVEDQRDVRRMRAKVRERAGAKT